MGGLLRHEWRALDGCDRWLAAVWRGLLRIHDAPGLAQGINDQARLRRGHASGHSAVVNFTSAAIPRDAGVRRSHEKCR